jgi:glycine/D-amino acid oxidase-like deaminating enzyme/nitrite reductase/ring-hydroxylating ferredoxin subunit
MISRDGTCTSLWQDAVPPYRPANTPELKKVYDVIIAGGGITGITTALLLQEAGKKCIVVEANNLCFGTTGGTTAHLNTLLDTPYNTISKNFSKEKAKLVAQSAQEAIDLIRRNITTYKIDCGFEEADAFLFAQDDKQEKELEEIRKATMEAGVDAVYDPQLPKPFTFTKAIRVKGQAKFIPTRYVYALARMFEKAGGIIVQQCRVTGAEENEIITVETTLGEIKGNALIYATHIPPAVNLLHLRCIPYRSYAMAVTLMGDKTYPKELFYDMYDPYHYYRTQEVNGQSYLIGGGYDHKTAHGDNTENCFRQLEAHLRETFNVKEVVYKWSSQYFEPADGIPYIGSLPGHSGKIYVATGYGGNGMTYSNVAALLLKKIILNEESAYLDLYNPNRIKPVAGFVNFIKHNADVVRQFAGKWFPHEELEELAALVAGEGKVVVFDSHKIALYKDEEGQLHAVDPVCTHLKCEVKWNSAEKSWDCPCHGARYSFDGKVLTGPADHDLEPLEIHSLIEK